MIRRAERDNALILSLHGAIVGAINAGQVRGRAVTGIDLDGRRYHDWYDRDGHATVGGRFRPMPLSLPAADHLHKL